MNILLTNDDGIDHPGLQTLLLTLSKKHNVFTMAPDRNRSGFGSAVTFLTDGAWWSRENAESLNPKRKSKISPKIVEPATFTY